MVVNHFGQPDGPQPIDEKQVKEYTNSLQTDDQQRLMSLVEKLRRSGLSSLLPLPQIVVCGDQSSGKSSVLEAITEIPFPRKENLCTRFATQITMRRGDQRQISCSINPDNKRPEDEQSKIREFARTINDIGHLPSIISQATEIMGLDNGKAFSRDVLSIEIWGTNLPQLTVVDLPGLIHSANKAQTEDDVGLIQSLVNNYISEKRTIILAVVSAKNDYANQIILKKCREVDPNGARTLGIITKPDHLRPGSDNEASWLELAKNQNICFELGWHILRNRKDDEHHLTFLERNVRESEFFNTGSYQFLSDNMKGITSLRERLSILLYNHMKNELPVLKSELDTMMESTKSQLSKLGRSRSTTVDQKLYLSELFTAAWEVLRLGSHGDYDHKFFGSPDLDLSIKEGGNARRLRAVVQSLNMQFADKIRLQGHKHDIVDVVPTPMATFGTNAILGASSSTPTTSPTDMNSSSRKRSFDQMEEQPCPKKIVRQMAIKRVIEIMERSRGRELFGTFNPLIICQIFKEESIRWEPIAREHLTTVANACKQFVLDVLSFVSAKEVKPRILASIVQPALKASLDAAIRELGLIMEDKERHAITYNHYFTDTLQKMQRARHFKVVKSLADSATIPVQEKNSNGGGFHNNHYISPEQFTATLRSSVTPDMSKYCAEEVLDAHDAFYKDEMKYFVGVITKQVIERHLVSPVAEVLSPNVLARLDDKQISDLVGEPPESLRMREYLSDRLKILEEGQNLFNAAFE